MQSLTTFTKTIADTQSTLNKDEFGSAKVAGGFFPYQSLRIRRQGRNPSAGGRSVSNYGMQMRFQTQYIARGLTPDYSNI